MTDEAADAAEPTDAAEGLLFDADALAAMTPGQIGPSGTPLPDRPEPPELDPHQSRSRLQHRLRTVLAGLPAFFEFGNTVAGVDATDLHSLNTLLGTSIETQVVRALNQHRALWDPDNEWLGFTFERQAQRFPDVRLIRKGGPNGVETGLGIELKGWFLLAKEGEPSFRFTTTPAACADHDLLVVVPWYLDNVLSGAPVAAEPYVESARWVATFRNWYWTHARGGSGATDRKITAPPDARPYPGRDVAIADMPAYDGGKNFGRVARVPELMTEFVERSNQLQVLGIRIDDWRRFLRMHSDQADPEEVTELLERELRRRLGPRADAAVKAALDAAYRLSRLLGD